MINRKKQWFGYVLLPLIMIAFCAVATFLYYLPEIRYEKAKQALESGDYERAESLAGQEDSVRAAELSEAAKLEQARKLADGGKREEARKILKALPETEEVTGLLCSLDYADAIDLFETENWDDVIAAFEALRGYRDSYRYIDRAKTAIAEEYYLAGDKAKAADAFLATGIDENISRAYEIAKEETGIDDPEEALQTLRGYDAETVAKLKQMHTLRKETEMAVLAAGFSHTLGLKADGTVLAAGDNTYRQCETAGWTGIVEVAAGAYHSAGLKEDGTVVAAGDNTYGQCEVTGWTDVIHIAANNYDTFALTRDGKILHTGFHVYAELDNWPDDLVSVSAGSYAVAAVRRNGGMLSSHESGSAPEFSGLYSVAVQTGYALGLTEDGTPLSHGVSLPGEWKDIVILYAGTNRILALTSGRTLLEHAFREGDRLLDQPESGVIAAANGATHIAVLYEDGTVRCFGSDAHGECGTGDWNLLA